MFKIIKLTKQNQFTNSPNGEIVRLTKHLYEDVINKLELKKINQHNRTLTLNIHVMSLNIFIYIYINHYLLHIRL